MIPESEVAGKSRDKSARFAFKLELLGDGSFRIVGKTYRGKVERRGPVYFVGCTCPGFLSPRSRSCYHLPAYLAEFKRLELLASINVGDEIEFSLPHANDCRADDVCRALVVAVGERRELFTVAGMFRAVDGRRVRRVTRRAARVAVVHPQTSRAA
jgi:hypothetical protein